MKIDLDDNFEAMMRRIWPDVPTTSSQYRESRKVWFATIHWLLGQFLKLAELPDGEGEAVLLDWHKQVQQFHQELKTTYKEDFR